MDKTEPTTEQQGTPIVPPDLGDMGNVPTFIEPGMNDEQGNEVRQELETDEPEVEEEAEAPVEEYEDYTPTPTVEDPGTYTPKDYSFEVTVYDEEGKNGKSVKVKSIEEWEELLDKDSNFGTSSALLKAQRLATKMESNLDRDESEWKKKKDAFDEQSESAQAQQDRINNIAAEINYLVGKGKLPAVDKKYANADWSDPEVAKQPGVKEQVSLLNYMRKENDARVKAGLRPIDSVLDAYNAMQLEQRDKRAQDVKKKAGVARKEAGARVAGSSPAPVSSAPKGIAVGRGGSLRDLDLGW